MCTILRMFHCSRFCFASSGTVLSALLSLPNPPAVGTALAMANVPASSAIAPPAWTADSTWRSLKAELDGFPGGLTLLEMCAGCGTAGLALSLLLGPGRWSLSGLYNRDPELRPVLGAHEQDMHQCHLGLCSGDLLRIPVEDFPSAHVVVAGPPCLH